MDRKPTAEIAVAASVEADERQPDTHVGAVLPRLRREILPDAVAPENARRSRPGRRRVRLAGVEFVARYAPEHMFRVSIRPGLTGLVQVLGRGSLSFEERLAVQRKYIESLSPGRDLRILAMTVAPVLTGCGVR